MRNDFYPGFWWSMLFDLVGLPDGDDLVGATITANIVDDVGQTELVAPRLQSDSAPADYAQNLINIEFTNNDTNGLLSKVGQRVLVRVKVTRGAKSYVYDAGKFQVVKPVIA